MVDLPVGLGDCGMVELNSCMIMEVRDSFKIRVHHEIMGPTSWKDVSRTHTEKTLCFRDSFAFPVGATINLTANSTNWPGLLGSVPLPNKSQ